MNKYAALRFITLSSLALPLLASAQYGGMQGSYSLAGIGMGIANAMWIVFTVIAIVMFVVAGIQFLTAQGDGEKLGQARMSVVWGLVGIIVAILAYGAVTFVKGSLGL